MHDTHLIYELRIEKVMSPALAALFPEFVLVEKDGDSFICADLPDQAALHGLLARIRDLGLALVSVERKRGPS